METNEIDREFGHGSTGTHRVNVPLTKKRDVPNVISPECLPAKRDNCKMPQDE